MILEYRLVRKRAQRVRVASMQHVVTLSILPGEKGSKEKGGKEEKVVAVLAIV